MQTKPHSPERRSPWLFFLITFALSVPLWIIGPKLGGRLPVSFNLPVSALQLINPLIAALILTPTARGKKALLKRAFDAKKIKDKRWYAPILLLNPLIMVLSYAVMRIARIPLPEPRISIIAVAVFFVVFFFTSIAEELGWMGYAYDPLEDRWGTMKASLILGLAWAALHLIPDTQLDHSAGWIAAHRVGTVANRILIVWLYKNTGGSVLSSVLYHDMLNIGWAFFPNDGSHYNPFVTTGLTLAAVIIVLLGWGTKTMTRQRLTHEGPKQHPMHG